MQYLVRVFVAIITFAIGSGVAALISPSVRGPHQRAERNCRAGSFGHQPIGRDTIDPSWVFVRRDLDWRKAPVTAVGGVAVNEELAAVDVANSEIAIFYPSGKFAFIRGKLWHPRGTNDHYEFTSDSGLQVQLGTWGRDNTGKIVITAVPQDGKFVVTDHGQEVASYWEMVADDRQPYEMEEIVLDRKVFAHLLGRPFIDQISNLIAMAAVERKDQRLQLREQQINEQY